jgi:hypothetical protein
LCETSFSLPPFSAIVHYETVIIIGAKDIIIGDLITYLPGESFSNKYKQLRVYIQVAKLHQDSWSQGKFPGQSDVTWLFRCSYQVIYRPREVFCGGVQVLHRIIQENSIRDSEYNLDLTISRQICVFITKGALDPIEHDGHILITKNIELVGQEVCRKVRREIKTGNL